MIHRSNDKGAIGRTYRQAEDSQRQMAKLRAKGDHLHADLKRSQTAERIACEEADHMREQVVLLESIVRDLRSECGQLGRTIGALRVELAEARRNPWRLVWDRFCVWTRDKRLTRSAA